jgi:hypothetical protein
MLALLILGSLLLIFILAVIFIMVAVRPFGKSIEDEEKKRSEFRHL